MLKNILFAFAGIFLLAACDAPKMENPESGTPPPDEEIIFEEVGNVEEKNIGEAMEQENTSEIDTSDWLTYRNEETGIELKYPEGWYWEDYSEDYPEGSYVISFYPDGESKCGGEEYLDRGDCIYLGDARLGIHKKKDEKLNLSLIEYYEVNAGIDFIPSENLKTSISKK